MFRKLIVFLMVLSLIFMSVAPSVFAAFTVVNIGPTTDLAGDVNVPTGKGYYINSTLLAFGDITNALGVTMANVGSTAINASLIPDSADDTDLGSGTYEWRALYIGTAGKIYLGLTQEVTLEVTDANTLAITASSNVDFSGGLDVTAGIIVGADIVSDAADTDNLGATDKEWKEIYISDAGHLYLGSGQDVNLQRSASNTLTLTASTGVLLDGPLGITGTRVSKGWFADVESTSMYTVGGVALTSTFGPLGNFCQHMMDVDAADTDYVHAAITGTGASNDVTTAITNPDYGRIITVTCTNTNSPSGNVTITGTLADGTTSATDVIIISAGGTANGVEAFVYVSNINVPSGVPAEDEVTIGIGDIIGLQNSISAEADIYLKTVDGIEEYGEISGNGNTTYNTLDCSTIVQNEDITIYYHP